MKICLLVCALSTILGIQALVLNPPFPPTPPFPPSPPTPPYPPSPSPPTPPYPPFYPPSPFGPFPPSPYGPFTPSPFFPPSPVPFPCACAPGPPVCASNGQTYYGECNLRCASVSLRIQLTVIYYGRCEDLYIGGGGVNPVVGGGLGPSPLIGSSLGK